MWEIIYYSDIYTCVKQTTDLASPIGDYPKDYWFYRKVLGN